MALSCRFKLLLAVAVLAVSIFALATVAEEADASKEFIVDGNTYVTLDDQPGEAAFKKYSSSENEFSVPGEVSDGTVKYRVTKIADQAFAENSSIEKITLSGNISEIGNDAFHGCSSLLSMTIPSAVTVIGDSAFKECSKLSTVVLNDCPAAIMDSAFASCGSMKSIDLGDKVRSIGGSAFYNCILLTSVKFSNSMTTVGSSAFNKCTSLVSATLNDGLEHIGDLAFYDCSSLTSIVIPNSVKTIGDSAFTGCTALASADIGTGMTSIGKEVFKYCSGFTSLTFRAVSCDDLTADSALLSGDMKPISVVFTYTVTKVPANLLRCGDTGDDANIISVSLSTNIKFIGDSAFANLRYLTSVDIPDGIETIGNDAFAGCILLSVADLGDTVRTIGDGAFSGCVALKAVSMPDSVTSVGQNAYTGCTGLGKLRIGGSVASIGASAFRSCTSLTDIEYHAVSCADMKAEDEVFYDAGVLTEGVTVVICDGVTKIPANLFYVSDETHAPKLVSVTIGKDILSIGDNAFRNCLALEQLNYCVVSCGNLSRTSYSFTRAGRTNGMTVTITADVTSIPDYLFCCEGGDDAVFIDELNIGDSVGSIGAYAFHGCDRLKSAVLPGSLKTISSYSFCGSGLTSINISGTVQSVGESAFKDCIRIGEITLGQNIESIGDGAFMGCIAITAISYGLTSASPAIGINIFSEAGSATSSGITLTVTDSVNTLPSGLFDTTENGPAPNLKQVKCGNSLQYIGNNTFRSCSNLADITFMSQLLGIGDHAFEGTGLIGITIPDSVTTIGDGAFQSCKSLVTVSLPASLSTISEAAFKDSGLSAVAFPGALRTIENSAFRGCKDLQGFEMTGSLSSIGDYAFEGCTSLSKAELVSGLESIGEQAFSNCPKMGELTIPDTVKTIGNGAFRGASSMHTLRYEAASVDGIGNESALFYGAGSNTSSFTVTIGASAESIPGYLFYVDSSYNSSPRITNLVIESGPETIGEYAFANCTHMTAVDMSGSTIAYIGDYSFCNCTGITNLSLSNELLFIREGAFYSCSSISEITLPKYLLDIEDDAFNLATSLKTVNNNSLLQIERGSSSYGGVALNVEILKGVVWSGTSGNYGVLYNLSTHICKIVSFTGSNETLTIPSTLKVSYESCEVVGVGSGAFKDDTKLTEVTFSEGVSTIESDAFSGCSSMYTVTLPASLRYIDKDAIPGARFFDTDGKTELPIDKHLADDVYTTPEDGNYYKGHYAVKYLIDGDKFGSVEAYLPGDTVTVRPVGTKTGYTVGAWVVPETVEDGKFKMPSMRVDIRATSTVNEYSISFDSTGGTYVAPITQAYGSKVSSPKNPIKTGCTFYRWMYNGEPYEFTTMPAEDITVYAEWTLNYYYVYYVIDGKKDTSLTESYEYNSVVTIREKYVKEGYTVTDWDVPKMLIENDYRMLPNDIQITATTSINSYTVKYLLDGVEIEEYGATVQYHTSMVLKERIVKEGYTVTDWEIPQSVVLSSDRKYLMPACDVVFKATSSINTYYVRYFVDSDEVFTDGYLYDQKYTVRERYVKEGYTVTDWDSSGEHKMPASDVYITAQSTINSYTITFDTACDQTVPPITQEYGTDIFAPEVTYTGHTLQYWDDGGKAFVFTTMPARDVHLVAVWKINQHTITFDSAGGSAVEPITQDYGTLVKQPNDPVLEGHRLRCWMEGVNDYVFGLMPDNDVHLTASWNVNVYDIYYLVDGIVIDTSDSPYGEKVEIREKYVDKGYTLSDWKFPEGVVVEGDSFIMPAFDVYITAERTPNYYTITFDSMGGTEVAPITQQYLTPVAKPDDPYLEGMHLVNWMLNGEPFVFDLMPNEDITLKADWESNTYHVRYYVGGEIVIDEEQLYGSSHVVIREAYIKEGYDVGDWTYDPTKITVEGNIFCMPAYDVAFYAEQKVRSHTVTYYFDDEEYIGEATYDYGTIITVPDKPVKTGYTVSEWASTSVTIADGRFSMPDYDVRVESYLRINSYDVIYTVDGETIYKDSYVYDTTAKIRDKYSKTGYEVSDWAVPEEITVTERTFTMPAYDVTLTAQSSIRQYTVTYLVDGEQYGDVEQYDYSAQVKVRDRYVREGYTVKAWTYPSYVKPVSGVFSMPDRDVVITTTTTVNEYKVTYYVDSSYKYYDKFDYGTTVTMRPVYVQEGYTVTDWVGPQSLVITDRTFVVPAYDVELDAFTSINTYKVTYLVDGEPVGQIESYKYNTKVELRSEYEKTGYTVTPWQLSVPVTYGYFNVPAYDLDITATSQVNVYTVRYLVDGVLYKSENHDYGTEVKLQDRYELEGYDVTDWSGPESLVIVDRKFMMIDSNVEFTATSTVKLYKIFYYVEDELKFTDSSQYHSKVTMRPKYKITGYTAAEWSVEGTGPEIGTDRTFTMPAYDVTLKTTLTLNKHTITYKVDGYAIDTPEEHWYNELVTVREPYTREGYTIQPWSKSGTFYMPDYDMTITSTSTVNKHYVTYYVDGTMIESTQYAYGTSISLREQYTKTGYTVTPWDVPVEVKGDKFYMPDFDVAITATTSINSYTITFDSNGGTEVEPMVVIYGSPTTEPTPPTRVGYEFNCWTYNSRPYSFTTMPAYDLLLKASWDAVKYNVIYKVNGVVVDTEEHNYKDVVTVKDTYVKPGYTVSPWDKTGTFFMPAEDVTIRATSKINKYTITFDSAGGTSVSSITKYYGESIYKPNDPSLYGHTFLYWAKDGQEFAFTTMPAENVNLVAVWMANPHNVTYYVNDEIYVVEVHQYGEEVTVRDKYTKEGYRATDWSITGTFVMPDNDVDIKATVVINNHTVTYYVDGEQVGDVEVYMSMDTVIIRDKYVKEGYTVSKWTVKTIDGAVVTTSSIKFDMPDADVAITATSKINKYTMYFNTNGGSYVSSIKAEYGTFIERPDDPTKDGYVFSTWMVDDEPYEITTMPAYNITLTAFWIRDVQESDVYMDGTTNFIECKDTGVVLIGASASKKLASNITVTLYINNTIETMSAQAYKDLYGGSEMTMNVTTSTGLENPKALAKLNVYDLAVVTAGTLVSVKVIGGGKVSGLDEISVKVPYTIVEDGSSSDIAVYFVSEDGNFTRMSSSYTKDGYVEFKTTHFSEFIICEHALFIEKSGESSSDDSQFSTILIAVAVIAVGALIGMLIYRYFRRPSF